jgi:hypothetical protein
MRDLFNYRKPKSLVNLKLFCDELKLKDKWLYIGILIVPEFIEKDLISKLLNNRCNHPADNKVWGQCSPPCPYHQKNNKEAHFKEISNSKDKYFIAERWIKYLLKDRKNIYFYILGINLNNLDRSYFGDKKGQLDIIYNRFFRTAILKSVKSFFRNYDQIIINDIYHDKDRSLEVHDYFSWHSIFFIESRDDKIDFCANEIKFLDSDHRVSKNQYSHFIQFIDLVLGCVNNCLDYTSKKKDKENISLKSLELIERLVHKPNNIRSRYNYVGRQKIEFFPKNNISNIPSETLEYQCRKMASFYTKRQLRIKERDQLSLFTRENSLD